MQSSYNATQSVCFSSSMCFALLQDQSGQHNLSIALRHILQQYVDSSNASGHRNTDMLLPHDGYVQRLSWYFECDKCQYKAFYSHDMESHKMMCYAQGDSKLFVKKRKLGMPKKMPSLSQSFMEGERN